MQQDDVAAPRLAQVADYSLRRFFFPVLPPGRPHYGGAKTSAVQGGSYLQAARAKRGTHPLRIVADGIGDRTAAGFELGPDAARRLKREDRVSVSVITDDVPGGGDARRQGGKLPDAAADQKKCSVNIVTREQVEELR